MPVMGAKRIFGNYLIISTLTSPMHMSHDHTSGLNEWAPSPCPHLFDHLYILGSHNVFRKNSPVALEVRSMLIDPVSRSNN